MNSGTATALADDETSSSGRMTSHSAVTAFSFALPPDLNLPFVKPNFSRAIPS